MGTKEAENYFELGKYERVMIRIDEVIERLKKFRKPSKKCQIKYNYGCKNINFLLKLSKKGKEIFFVQNFLEQN